MRGAAADARRGGGCAVPRRMRGAAADARRGGCARWTFGRYTRLNVHLAVQARASPQR
jgi:hypothetical protein